MPFLHAGWEHLLSNTIPLCILLFMLLGSRKDGWEVMASIAVLGGGMLWCFGRPALHIGASGLVYGLVAFLIVSGFIEQRLLPAFALERVHRGPNKSSIPRLSSAIVIVTYSSRFMFRSLSQQQKVGSQFLHRAESRFRGGYRIGTRTI